MHQVCLVMSQLAVELLSYCACFPCSTRGICLSWSYVCTVGDTRQPAVIWRISCHTSSPAGTSCDSDPAHVRVLAIRQNEQSNFTPCESDADLLFTLNFVQGVSNLSIAIPRNTAITRLEISCEASCKYLHIQG